MSEVVALFDFEGLRREIDELERHRVGSRTVARAVEHLNSALEELQTAGEELEAKNEELAHALIELEAEHARYRQLFDFLPDGCLIADAKGRVTEANARAAELLETRPEALAGRSVMSAFGAAVGEEIRRLAATGSGSCLIDHRGRLLEVRVEPLPRRLPAAGRAWVLRDVGGPEVEGDDLATEDAEVARSWLAVYTELIAISEQSIEALERMAATGAARDRVRADRRGLEARLARLRHRQLAWRDRHAELVGVRLDRDTGCLRAGLKEVRLTRREAQLLAFLLKHPGTTFSADALLNRAWLASFLSPEQLRTYVGRLRAKLEEVGAACRLENVRGQGYRLVF